MNLRKIIRVGLILVVAALIMGGGIGLYLFKMPHRNVSKTEPDFEMTSSQLVQEFLEQYDQANQKYLSADGNSSILKITGPIAQVSQNLDGQMVLFLKESLEKAGVTCAFDENLDGLEPGQRVTIKGVIRSGANYDSDLDLFENVVIEKCILLKN